MVGPKSQPKLQRRAAVARGWPVGYTASFAAVPGTEGALGSLLWTNPWHRVPREVRPQGHRSTVLGLPCTPDGMGLLENCPACLETVLG